MLCVSQVGWDTGVRGTDGLMLLQPCLPCVSDVAGFQLGFFSHFSASQCSAV